MVYHTWALSLKSRIRRKMAFALGLLSLSSVALNIYLSQCPDSQKHGKIFLPKKDKEIVLKSKRNPWPKFFFLIYKAQSSIFV